MKILVDKNSKVVLAKCEDDVVVSQDKDKTCIGSDLLLWGITSSNSDIVENVTLPTSLVVKLYSYDSGTWTELWETVKAKAKVVKECDDLLADVPSGTQSQWNEYVAKITTIKDGLMETIDPRLVTYPKKPQ